MELPPGHTPTTVARALGVPRARADAWRFGARAAPKWLPLALAGLASGAPTRRLTPSALRRQLDARRLSPRALADALGVSPAIARRWRQDGGATPPPRWLTLAMSALPAAEAPVPLPGLPDLHGALEPGLVRSLRARGYTLAQIGAAAGLTRQRVQQISAQGRDRAQQE